jgi:hypothetical protein
MLKEYITEFREKDGYLVIPKLYEVPERLLEDLLRLHRPQNLSYDERQGERGESYKNEWSISTYVVADQSTYVRKCFEEKYGFRDCLDRPMLRYLCERKVMETIQSYKKQFLKIRGEALNLSETEIELQRRHIKLSQLFLTVQPSKDVMKSMKTSLQPHYDPCELTINIHLSPLTFRGCNASENVLRIFRSDNECETYPTARGTVVFLWENKNKEACLHTANSISKGARVVLCAFFKDDRKKISSSSSLSTNEERSFELPFHAVDDVFCSVFSKLNYLFLNISRFFQGSNTIDSIVKESTSTRFDKDGVFDLFTRGIFISDRTSLEEFRKFRSACASSSSTPNKLLETILETVPSKITQILQCKDLFLFNEYLLFPSSSSSSSFRCDKDEIFGVNSAEFFSMLFVIQGTIEIEVQDPCGRIEKLTLRESQNSIFLSSNTPYRFLSSNGGGLIWSLQYSKTPIKSRNDVLAFAVKVTGQTSSSLRDVFRDKILTNTNGVIVEGSSPSCNKVLHMRRSGDCVVVPGGAFHQSVPGESNRVLVKMVVFFDSASDQIKEARTFRIAVKDVEMIDAFREVVTEWSNILDVKSFWSPYNDYPHTNGNVRDQMQCVRRVHSNQLSSFLSKMPHCAKLIRHLSHVLNANVCDLHFLRQVGSNSASFSKHLDIHDTGSSETSNITAGVSVLLGGYDGYHNNSYDDDDDDDDDDVSMGRRKKRRRLDDSTWLQYLSKKSMKERQRYEDAVRRVKLIKNRYFRSEEENILLEGCKCENDCSNHCTCPFECGDGCFCNSLSCTNQKIQNELKKKHTETHFEVCWFGNGKGFGVQTRVPILKGSPVLEYVGEVLTNLKTAQERLSIRESQETLTYIMTVLERSHLDKSKIKQVTCIDAHRCGNISRFVNHSCDPTCDVKCVRTCYKTPRLVFIANRDIPVGSEITISYGEGGGGAPCQCGSKRCRGTLPRVSNII